MKPETILNAFQWAVERRYWVTNEKSERQYYAFRNRLLDTVGRMEEHIRFQDDVIDDQKQRIAELEADYHEMEY